MTPRHAPAGFILISVLVVIMLASMVAVSLMFRMKTEETAATAGQGSEQAWSAAMSGISLAMEVAKQTAPGNLDWQDDPDRFRDHFLWEDGADRWYFTIYSAPLEADSGEVRYGLADEAGKLPVNQASEDALEKLPGMTPSLAEALLDYLDTDNDPRPQGAEQEYYDALSKPYRIRNGPLNTLDELLLVRGFGPNVLYGEDANFNFHLDLNEDDGDEHFPPDDQSGDLNPGLRQYLTAWSYEHDVSNDGQPRINLNQDSITFTNVDLPETLTNYLAALRKSQTSLVSPADLLEATQTFKGEDGKEVELESGVGKDELPVVLDLLTTRTNEMVKGLININTAASQVLQTLPDVDESLAETIVSTRRGLRDEARQTTGWLYQEGLVKADGFKTLAPFLTARSYQFRFQVIGYALPSGRYRVLEAVIDTAGKKPAIIYLRDLTRLGLPFALQPPMEAPAHG